LWEGKHSTKALTELAKTRAATISFLGESLQVFTPQDDPSLLLKVLANDNEIVDCPLQQPPRLFQFCVSRGIVDAFQVFDFCQGSFFLFFDFPPSLLNTFWSLLR
jgi:hypothetical protein